MVAAAQCNGCSNACRPGCLMSNTGSCSYRTEISECRDDPVPPVCSFLRPISAAWIAARTASVRTFPTSATRADPKAAGGPARRNDSATGPPLEPIGSAGPVYLLGDA